VASLRPSYEEREAKRAALRAQRAAIEAELERLTKRRELLQVETIGQARQMLKKMLAAPLRAKPFRENGARGSQWAG